MTNVSLALVDELMREKQLPSYAAAVRLLDISEQAMRNWRHSRAQMSDETAVRVCGLIGKSERETQAVLAALALERAPEASRRHWAAMLKRLGGLAASVMLAAGSGSGPTPPSAGASAAVQAVSCVLCKIPRRKKKARWTTALARLAACLFPIHVARAVL